MLEGISMSEICSCQLVLLHAKMSIVIQKRHYYTRYLTSETPGDSKNAFLDCGDVLGAASCLHQLTSCKCLMLNDTLLLPQFVCSLCKPISCPMVRYKAE